MTFQCLNVSKYVKHVFGMPLGLMTHAFEVLVSSCSIIFYTRWWQLKYFFMFTPKIGEDSNFDEHIFSDGWSKTTNSFCLCLMSSRSIQPMPFDSIQKKAAGRSCRIRSHSAGPVFFQFGHLICG